jgi:cellulose synthase/poly-beta-1,6-N-acetylglucosamine synthase-like glycosyltransferase
MGRADVPRIDLITGSIGRTDCLRRMLDGLVEQDCSALRLFVVEQVDPQATRNLLHEYEDALDVVLLQSPRGLSEARNTGLAQATSEFVAFPDDDCWYRRDTLRRVLATFDARPELGLVCGQQLTDAAPALPRGNKPALVTKRNVWRLVVSSALFLRREILEDVGFFDTTLGVGNPTRYKSGEETDLALRVLTGGHMCCYEPAIVVHHPSPDQMAGRMAPELGYGYGLGMGRVLRRHRYGIGSLTYHVARPLAGAVVAGMKGDKPLARFRTAVARGRAGGYISGDS